MHDDTHPFFLLGSISTELVAAIRSSLRGGGYGVHAVASAEAALEAMRGERVPSLSLLDAELPGMAMGQLLAAVHSGNDERRFPIVLITDEEIPEWNERLSEGVIDDLFPRSVGQFHFRARVEMVLRGFHQARELEALRETTARNRDTDPLTGLLNRDALLAMLFRETDRVQRMNTCLAVMRLEVEDLEHWRSRLGEAACDEVVKQAVGRMQRLLRTYDLFGRVDTAGFVLGLPGCAPVNAVSLAERIRAEVFSSPFLAGGPIRAGVRLTACFGIASSYGRSPLIVLREAEQALRAAKAAGQEEIRSARDCIRRPEPAAFFSAPARRDRLTR